MDYALFRCSVETLQSSGLPHTIRGLRFSTYCPLRLRTAMPGYRSVYIFARQELHFSDSRFLELLCVGDRLEVGYNTLLFLSGSASSGTRSWRLRPKYLRGLRLRCRRGWCVVGGRICHQVVGDIGWRGGCYANSLRGSCWAFRFTRWWRGPWPYLLRRRCPCGIRGWLATTGVVSDGGRWYWFGQCVSASQLTPNICASLRVPSACGLGRYIENARRAVRNHHLP